jgi:FKBP-type peptidyl-prolyl cis-trans isomerase SlyD
MTETIIKKNSAVTIHYTLTNNLGELVDSSLGGQPLAYLHGARNIVVGLENALEGQQIGTILNVEVSPEEGYGAYREDLVQEVEKERFGDDFTLQVGDRFQVQTNQGPAIGCIDVINEKTVIVNFNHELAGKVLYFEIQVIDVRDASQEELEHGHIHGPGGHQH